MIRLRPLLSTETALLTEVLHGYASAERYRVTLQESDAETTIKLALERLPEPYVKDFRGEVTPEDLENYTQIAAEGLSVLALENDHPVGIGLAGAQRWNGTLWIWEFHVRPEYQGQGIGRRMMDALAETGRAAGMRTMRVETQNTNVPAIRFYRKAGFGIESVDVSFYTNDDLNSGEVAIFMKRRLT